jgi:hypothetical protein
MIKEKISKKCIYYSHSMQIYQTKREAEEITLILSYFPDIKVINPSEIDFQGLTGPEIMERCYELIARSDIVIFTEYRDSIGMGVYSEVRRARDLGKPVYLLRESKLFQIEKENLTLFEYYDWTVHYAKVRGIKVVT